MAVGNQPTPTPAPGTMPAAPTPAPAAPTAPGAPTTPGTPAPPAPAAPAHSTGWRRVVNWMVLIIVIVAFILGYFFGVMTWDHRRAAWHVGWGLVFVAFALAVYVAIDSRRYPAAPCSGATTPPVPPAPGVPAPPATPPTPTPCALTVDVWTDVGGHQFLQDAAGTLWRNDPTAGVVRVT